MPVNSAYCIKCSAPLDEIGAFCSQCGHSSALAGPPQQAGFKFPKCMVCGYVGLFKKPPIIYPRDLIISLLLFAVAGSGIIWFIISVFQKKPMSCPVCKAKGTGSFDY